MGCQVLSSLSCGQKLFLSHMCAFCTHVILSRTQVIELKIRPCMSVAVREGGGG